MFNDFECRNIWVKLYTENHYTGKADEEQCKFVTGIPGYFSPKKI